MQDFVTKDECRSNRQQIQDDIEKTKKTLSELDKREAVTSTIVNRIDKALWILISSVISQTVVLLFGIIKNFI